MYEILFPTLNVTQILENKA